VKRSSIDTSNFFDLKARHGVISSNSNYNNSTIPNPLSQARRTNFDRAGGSQLQFGIGISDLAETTGVLPKGRK
jgi:hypothetical protein